MVKDEIKSPVYIGSYIRWTYVKKFLPKVKEGILLDVGAGQCEYKELCESKGYTYIAIDPDPKSPAQRGNILDLPFSDNSVNVVILIDVLEHIEEDSKAIKEIRRILKPDGLLIMHVPNLNQKHILIEEVIDQDDHVRKGYCPVSLHTLFYDWDNPPCYATFDYVESIAWDLAYVARNKIPINPFDILDKSRHTHYGWIVLARK